jgi:serine-type D-Ala-D-Ala carboxypeptidase/endopeptidase (penicillin-binding protein 4)
VVSRTISSLLGINPHVVDGSGLSEEDQTSPYQVTDLLSELASTPIGVVLREHMAVAGRTGTLELRMRDTAAAGRCQGKTGTLTGVSNLVGYCQSQNGQLLAFAIFTDGIPTEAAHVFQDNMTITLADSNLALPAVAPVAP